MGWRGRHSRSYIWVRFRGASYADECEVAHEEKNPNGRGVFDVVDLGQTSPSNLTREVYVVWRPNRNTTRDTCNIIVMRDDTREYWDQDVRYDTVAEAIESIPYWSTKFTPPDPYKRRVRDAQKRKVYRWEWIMADRCSPTAIFDPKGANKPVKTLTVNRNPKALTEFLHGVCHVLEVKPPVLKFRTGGRASNASGMFWEIKLLPSHRNELVLLHELAHCLHERWRGRGEEKHQAHGKEFVGIFVYLLVRFGHVDLDQVEETLTECKVKCELPTEYYRWLSEEDGYKEAACPA